MEYKPLLHTRLAGKDDIPLIYSLINGLALYEKRPQDMTGTKEQLLHWLFGRNIATVLIAEYHGEAIGYALYYPIFASFAAAGKVHLEDLFIRSDMRGKGFGSQLLANVCTNVLSEGYAGIELSCLDWNKPSIEFYKSLGAGQDSGREYFYFSKERLEEISKRCTQKA